MPRGRHRASPAGQPPIPASPSRAPTCGRAGLRLSPQRRAPRGQEQRRGERGAPVTWYGAGAGGGLSAFVPQTSRWRRGAWPALLAPARPALPPASPLAGRAPPRADWAPPAPLLPGERGRGVEAAAAPSLLRVPARPRAPSTGNAGSGRRGQATPPGLPAGPASAPLGKHRARPPPERPALGTWLWPQAWRHHPGTHRLGPVPFTSLTCGFHLRRPQQPRTGLSVTSPQCLLENHLSLGVRYVPSVRTGPGRSYRAPSQLAPREGRGRAPAEPLKQRRHVGLYA